MICENCGRVVDSKTLTCNFCGTDYNSYDTTPKCEHLYGEWFYEYNMKDCTVDLFFKCKKCGEIITLKCENGILMDAIGFSNRGL